MRKLSIAPLFLLLVMFLWTRFSHAAPLPTTLPAKKKTAASKTTALPAKKTSRRPIIIVDTSAPGLAKTLPTRKKLVMNFDQPALPEAPSVVIREDGSVFAPSGETVLIQRHDVTEAPVLEFVGPEPTARIEIPNTAARSLVPALPDSDSYEMVPSQTGPVRPVVIAPPVVAPVIPSPAPAPATAESTASATANSVAIANLPAEIAIPRGDVSSLTVAPSASVLAESTAAATTASVSAPSISTAVSTAEALSTAEPTTEVSSTSIATSIATATSTPVEATTTSEATASAATLSATSQPADAFGPPAPPVFDTSITESKLSTKSTDITVAENALDADKGTPGTRASELKASTTFLVPSNEIPRRRLFIRGGYLDAAYSKLESDLKNGATLFGVSASQVFSKTEVRVGVDFAYGLDQSISLRNTRMAMFRAEGLYNLASFKDTAAFYIGGALGLADIQVTSFRSKNANGDVTIRENARGTAFLGSPEVGSRIYIGRQVSLDLTVQYLLLLGGDQVSNLGGLLGEAALGFRF